MNRIRHFETSNCVYHTSLDFGTPKTLLGLGHSQHNCSINKHMLVFRKVIFPVNMVLSGLFALRSIHAMVQINRPSAAQTILGPGDKFSVRPPLKRKGTKMTNISPRFKDQLKA